MSAGYVLVMPRARATGRKRRGFRPPRRPDLPWWYCAAWVGFDAGSIIGAVARIVQQAMAGHAVDPWEPVVILSCLVNARIMLWAWGKWR